MLILCFFLTIYLFNNWLSQSYSAVMKHHDHKQIEEERVHSAYMCTLMFLINGGQDRNSKRTGT